MSDVKHEEEQKKHKLNEPEPDELDVNEMHLGLTREHGEPREGHEPMPLWLPMLITGLLIWAGYYVGRYAGPFEANSYDPIEVGGGGKPGAAATGSPKEAGQAVFRTTCVTCHQESGRGVPGQYPPLAGSSVLTKDPETPIRIVLHGLSGPLSVDGSKFDGTMPAWGGTLNDQQIADVLTYVRSSWGNKASGISAEQVKKVRDQYGSRGKPWSAQELHLSP